MLRDTRVNGSVPLVSQRLMSCRKALSKWKKSNFSNSQDKIHQCEVALEKLQSDMWPDPHQVHFLKRELSNAYRQEEQYWKTRNRQKWLRSGNRNSKFFHGSVKSNRARKRIEVLSDENGVLQKSDAAKGELATAYFEKLFKSSNPVSFQEWFSGFSPKVTEEMNEVLIGKVSAEEIKEAVFSIKPASAPGADGMSGLFFQQYWSIVGEQVTKEVQLFFDQGIFPTEWNYTHLCLLPKKSTILLI